MRRALSAQPLLGWDTMLAYLSPSLCGLSSPPGFGVLERIIINEHRRAERWTALNYASHYPFSRSKARSQQQAQSHTTKIMNQVCFA